MFFLEIPASYGGGRERFIERLSPSCYVSREHVTRSRSITSERHVSTALIEPFNSWSLRFGRRSLKKNRDNHDSPEYTFFYKEHSKAAVSTRDDAEQVQNFQKGSIEFRIFPLLRRTRNFIHFLLLFLVCLQPVTRLSSWQRNGIHARLTSIYIYKYIYFHDLSK